MTIALASMALYALNQALNPDDWDKMEDWEKDTYFHFWVDGEHFRLPKPFEVGFIFGTIPERMMEQLITDKSGGVFASRVFAGFATSSPLTRSRRRYGLSWSKSPTRISSVKRPSSAWGWTGRPPWISSIPGRA